MDISELNHVKGLIQVNSIDYLEQAFQSLERKEILAPLKNHDFCEQVKHLNISKVITPKQKFGWYSPKFKLTNEAQTAQISFTSGTEGEPKGIILTHENLQDTVERLVDIMEITSDIREYIGVPVYHSFGYGRARVSNHVGGKVYIPAGGFNPQEIADLLAKKEINAISAVPTLWRILLQQKHLFTDVGQYIRWIEIGSQFMFEEEKEALSLLFPNALIVQHYGLTEASRSTFLVVSDGINLNTVGEPTGNNKVRLSEAGLIEIKGSNVANYQITSTGLKKIVNEEGWFTTSDLGLLEKGQLTFLGRADDIINIGGLKVSPEALERQISNTNDMSGRLVITKIDDPIRGETILINILNKYSSQVREIQLCVKNALKGLGITLGGEAPVQMVSEFPFTDTGKVERKKLSAQYIQQVSSEATVESNASLIEKLAHSFKLPSISEKDSFLSLNGDSLLLMMMSIEIEQHIGYIPENWEAMTFSQLDDLAQPVKDPISEKSYSYAWLLALVVCGLLLGEAFLQARSHIKTGRSAFNLINDESTVVYNENLDVKTYRPNMKLKDYKTGIIKYDINQLGLRSPSIDAQPTEDELRIAIVGASSVAGAYAERNQNTFSSLLEQNLRLESSQLVNVINGGVEGVTLNGILSITDKLILPLKPHYVVIYTGFNDITSICRQPASSKTLKLQPLFKAPHLPHWLMTQDMIKKNTVALREAPKNKNTYIDVNKFNLAWYQKDIESIVNKVISHGATPILMTNARSYINVEKRKARELATTSLYYYYCLDLDGIIRIGERLNDGIRFIAQKNNIRLVDLAKTMPGGREYFVDGGHFTFKGEKYVAQQLTELFSINKQVMNVAN